MTPGRELDALVAEKVMGLKVGGFCPASCYPTGDDPRAEGLGTIGNMNGLHPFSVPDDCDCDNLDVVDLEQWDYNEGRHPWADTARPFGHSTLCLQWVPAYSIDIAAAWDVAEKVPYALCLMRVDGKWRAQFWELRKYTSRPQGEADAPTAPRAICVAALRAMGVEGV